jgi:hypothetical protein
MKFVFNSVQSNSKICLCTSVHFNVGTWFETTYHWSSWAYNTSHADKHVARALISFRYLSSYSRGPHWSVWTCIKIFLSYSVHCWKHKFHKTFRYWNISMYFCILSARTPCTINPGTSNEPTSRTFYEHNRNYSVANVQLQNINKWQTN